MLIDFFSSERQNRTYYYDSDKRYTVISSNNNLAFSKDSYFGDVQYSLEQKGGEDAYLCLRHLKLKNRYMINQDLKIQHYPRKGIKRLSEQFYNYSCFFNHAIHLTGYDNAEIYSYIPAVNKITGKYKLVSFKFFIPIMIILTQFHLMLLALPIYFFYGDTFTGKLISFLFAYSYVKEDLRGLPWGLKTITKLSLTRLIVNFAILWGSVKTNFKNKNFILMPNILEYPHKSSRFISCLNNENYNRYKEIVTDLTQRNGVITEDLKIEWLRFGWGYFIYKEKHILLKNVHFFKAIRIIKITDNKHEMIMSR